MGHDHDRTIWASATARDALALIRILRPATLRRARTLNADEGASVAHVLRMTAGHDLLHRRQIQRILDAVGA